MIERWADVPGYEGRYQVSEYGSVRSVDRVEVNVNGVARNLSGRLLKPEMKHGYWVFGLPGKKVSAHRLIALAFIPNPEGLPVVRHLNDVKTDNRLDNLAWGTYEDNQRDARNNGRNFYLNQTHCVNGHEFNEDNTYFRPDRPGTRECRRCQSKRGSESRRKSQLKGLEENSDKHGTLSGYEYHGCRCESCKQVFSVRQKERRDGRKTSD